MKYPDQTCDTNRAEISVKKKYENSKWVLPFQQLVKIMFRFECNTMLKKMGLLESLSNNVKRIKLKWPTFCQLSLKQL